MLISENEEEIKECKQFTELQELLVPYLFPLMVEYSVLAMAIALSMWEKCGWQEPEFFITTSFNSE